MSKKQKDVLDGQLLYSYFQTLISATVGAKGFSRVSSYYPQGSSNKGGTAARKFALDTQLVNSYVPQCRKAGDLEA